MMVWRHNGMARVTINRWGVSEWSVRRTWDKRGVRFSAGRWTLALYFRHARVSDRP